MTTPADLVAELADARAAFFGELERVEPASLTTPGLAGDWSARELIAHLGYWAGHAVETIHAVEQGRLETDEQPVDEVNATVARVARGTPLETVRRREAASVQTLLDRLRHVDAELLGTVLTQGGTLLEATREDGASHYREHADQLRRTLAETPRG